MTRLNFEIVEAVVFRRKAPAQFLVLRRSDEETIYPGLWQIVSGGIEKGEKAYEAAMREIREETGLTVSRLFNTPLTNTFYFFTIDAVNFSPVFAAEVDADAEVVLSPEHTEYRWLEQADARELLVWPGQKQAIDVVSEYVIKDNPSRGFMEISTGRR